MNNLQEMFDFTRNALKRDQQTERLQKTMSEYLEYKNYQKTQQ